MKPKTLLLGLGALAAAALVAATPLAGDWLVLRDGTRIETRGPWEVKGAQVVFTQTDGTFSALRKADVDLDASAAVSAAPSRPAPPPAKAAGAAPRSAASRKPVLVLTNDDIGPAAPEGEDSEAVEEAAGEEAAEDAGPEAAEPQQREPVEVVSWESHDSGAVDGLEISGRVRNTGDGIAAGVQVTVQVRDADGEPLFDTRAFLEQSSLAPGSNTSFRALLPGIYGLQVDPVFEVRSEALSIQAKTPEDDDAEPGETEEEPLDG